MKQTLLLTLLVGLLIQPIFAQTFDKAKLDSYFDALEANNRFMGSVAVSKDGILIYSKSVGYADVENNIKANGESKYRIGSISKTFTTVLVLKAVEENKLTLDQTIERYFPAITNANKITIKQLLTHRSGIHNFTNDASYLTWNTQAKTEAEMVDVIAKAGSDFEPNSKAQYSNSNFVLLTFIVEKGFGKSYADLVKELITRPIGLKNTYMGEKANTAANECRSYRFDAAWKLEAETDLSIPLGAGGIVSTPADLVRFSDALFGGKLLKPESLELMKTINDQFGMGLFKIPFYDKVGYGHSGGLDGFTSVFSYFPDGNVSYAQTSNGSIFNNNNISIAVLSAVYGKPYELPEFSTYTVNPDDLDQYLGVYSSAQIPLKITITRSNNALVAQATGQPSFPLEATAKDKFKFETAGVVMEFNPTEQSMLLKQMGGVFKFTKD
jgi:D-alanyl-D-alanine carboxypeptidase